MRNKLFVWVKYIEDCYDKWWVAINIDGLESNFYGNDSIFAYANRESARKGWLRFAKRLQLVKGVDWDYE